MRRATWFFSVSGVAGEHFNPRSPWGERLLETSLYISDYCYFNPHSPWGERLTALVFFCKLNSISIHALREESDLIVIPIFVILLNFNPRSPWGERPDKTNTKLWIDIHFNPRSPWGERHLAQLIGAEFDTISIHALREESDCARPFLFSAIHYFNPRSPWGERHQK